MGLIGNAMHNAAAHLAARGYEIPPGKIQAATSRLAVLVVEIHVNAPTEALDSAAFAAVLLVAEEILGTKVTLGDAPARCNLN
jgi:hypothetical protein